MAKPHWKPVNVTLTGNSALRKPQRVGGADPKPAEETGKNWFADEGFELARQALIRMQKTGWTGYEKLAPKKPKAARGPRKITAAQAKAWIAANPDKAAAMLAELNPEPLALAA